MLTALLILCGSIAQAHADAFVYVANTGTGTVSVIDTATDLVVAVIPTLPGGSPTQLALTPDGSRLYVTHSSLGGIVSVIDTATRAVLIPAIPTGFGSNGITTSPDGSRVYVANQFSNSVSVLDTATNTVIATVPVGFQPTDVVATPDGGRVYVAHSGGVVWVLDAATNSVLDGGIPVGGNSHEILVSPDGSRIYVSNFNSHTVSVIDVLTNTVQSTVPVGFFPLGMAISPDGARLYVVDIDPVLNNGSIAVVDTGTHALITRVTLPPLHAPRRIAMMPDGRHAYVTINTPQRVLVVDTISHVVAGDPITVEGIPEGLAVAPASNDRLVPFTALDAKLHIGPASRSPVSLMGRFVLGGLSDGIAAESDPIRISMTWSDGVVLVGQTLPAGSLRSIGRGDVMFRSSAQQHGIQSIRIMRRGSSAEHAFHVVLRLPAVVALTGDSLFLSLQIGDDVGTTVLGCRAQVGICQ